MPDGIPRDKRFSVDITMNRAEILKGSLALGVLASIGGVHRGRGSFNPYPEAGPAVVSVNDRSPFRRARGRRSVRLDRASLSSETGTHHNGLSVGSKPMRSHFLGLLFLSLASATPAPAATPEQDYLAARDRHSARLEKLESVKGGEDTARAEYDKALADLDARLQKLVGGLSVPGYPARGKISLESLTAGDIGSGMLDALRFQQGDGGPAITVTTDGLLERWLADWRRKEAKAPAKDEDALRSELFYTSAVGSEAAFTRDAVLDIPKPASVGFSFAQMGSWAQDIGPYDHHSLIVTLRMGGKVYIADSPLKAKVGRIPACNEIWAAARKKADKLQSAYVALKLKDTKLSDDRSAVEEKGNADYHSCFVEHAPREAWYPALVKEAAALAARITGH
jgi:hypothetical protein